MDTRSTVRAMQELKFANRIELVAGMSGVVFNEGSDKLAGDSEGMLSMKILVCLKQVTDPYVKVHLSKAGHLDINHVKKVINPFDAIALEEALRARENGWIQSVGVVSIGGDSVSEACRAGLAMGADEATHLFCETSIEPFQAADLIREHTLENHYDMVWMGKQAVDDDYGQTGQMVAAALKWPVICYASKIVWSQTTLIVDTEVDEGIQTFEASWPLVVTVDLRLNEPRYPTLPNIMKAKQKPLILKEVNAAGVRASRFVQMSLRYPEKRSQGIIVENPEQLVTLLREKDRVLG